MKKAAACITMAAVLVLSINAFAEGIATYDTKDASVEYSEASKYKTVLITDSSNKIVYINQATSDDPFTETTKFLFQDETPEAGKYKISFGSDNGQKISKDFYIGVNEHAGDVLMTRIAKNGEAKNEDGSYNIGYMANNVSGTYFSVIIDDNGTIMGYPIGSITLSNADIGIQINGVPEAKKSDVKVYLSTRSVDIENNTASSVNTNTGAAGEVE